MENRGTLRVVALCVGCVAAGIGIGFVLSGSRAPLEQTVLYVDRPAGDAGAFRGAAANGSGSDSSSEPAPTGAAAPAPSNAPRTGSGVAGAAATSAAAPAQPGEGSLRLKVALPDGTVPARAVVTLLRGGVATRREWTPEKPTIHVPQGQYEMTVGAGNFREWVSVPQVLTVADGGEIPVVSPPLSAKPGIGGRVRFEQGEFLGALFVTVGRIPEGDTAETGHLKNFLQAIHGPGSYHFWLEPGRYALGAYTGNKSRLLAVATVDVANRFVEFDLRVPPLPAESMLQVRGVGPSGETVRDAQLEVACQGPAWNGNYLRRADGVLLAFHSPHAAPANGAPCTVSVKSTTFGTREAPIPATLAGELVVRFEPPGDLEVSLVGWDAGRHAGKLRISLGAAGKDPRFPLFSPELADSRGRRSFLGIQPGEYEVRVAAGVESELRLIARSVVTVAGGSASQSVALPGLHDVTVTGAEEPIELWRTDDTTWRVRRTDFGDKVLFDLLPDGEYSVKAGAKSRTFFLPGTESVEL